MYQLFSFIQFNKYKYLSYALLSERHSAVNETSGSQPGGILPPGDIRPHLQTFLVVTRACVEAACSWRLVSGSQGCCRLSSSAQDSFPRHRVIQPKMSTGQRLRNLELDEIPAFLVLTIIHLILISLYEVGTILKCYYRCEA